ncbi:MAG: LamG-like jellyroll fold domain-containing protein [Pirellulales bacterium]
MRTLPSSGGFPSRLRQSARRRHAAKRPLNLETLENRLVLDSTVVFNEVMYHPAGNAPEMEWVELHNQMGVDMDLSRWRLDGIDFTFAEGTVIPGGGYLVVAADPAALQAATGFSAALGPFTGRLDNNGEQLRLLNNDDRVMDDLNYGDSGRWPVAPDGSGASLAKADPNTASADAKNWRSSIEVGGTPGDQNFAGSVPVLETVIESGATAKYLVPTDNSLGTDWTTTGFDDSAWTSGPTGVGYDTFELDYVAEVLVDTPAGYWRFEETSGAVAVDSSGNNRDAAINGGVTLGAEGSLAGDADHSARFDGSTGYVQLPGSWGGALWTELTIEAWVNTADPTTGTFQAVVAGHDPNAFAHFQLNNGGNTGVYTDVGFVATPIIPATPTGTWRHVVITSKSGESKVFVDGAQVGATVGSTFANIAESSNVSIGLGHQNGRWFLGRIDEVAIYDHVLSDERVQLHYLAGAGGVDPDPEPVDAELLAHWTFDDDATDAAGNHDGTLGGGASITTESIIGGGALDLRDVAGYVDIPSTVLNAEASFSIAFWVAADSLTALSYSSIYSNDAWSPGKLRVNVVTGTGAVELGVNGNSALPTTTGTIAPDGDWVHVALTYDSATGAVTAYFDGQAEPGVTLDTAGLVGVGPATIGAWDASGGGLYTRFLDGRIDDLQIYRGVLTAAQVSQLAVVPEPSQLLAHWSFDTDASDATGNHNGTLAGGASITTDARLGGGALDLRSVNGYVDVPTAVLNGAASFTVAMFVNADALSAGCCTALLANDSWAAGKLHVNLSAAGVPEAAINGNPTGAWGASGVVPVNGTWVHLAYTYDSATGVMTPYINGVAGTPGTGGVVTAVGSGGMNIGAWDTTGGNTQDRFLNGRIDELRVYGGALSPAEIAALAAAGGAPSPDASPANGPAAGNAELPISAYGVISTDVETQMLGVNPSAYVRVPFTVPSAAAIDQLILKMKYDDGFVAYINGVEVARRNAPATLTFNSTATVERANSAAVVFEQFDLAGAIAALHNGANVLAIQGLNLSADDSDFVVLPELVIHEADIEQVAIAFNEIAAAAETEFSVELANYGPAGVALGGYVLASSADTTAGFVLPAQTLAPGGFLTITESELGFRPADGDRLFLYTPDRRGVVDAVLVRNTRRARFPDATGDWLRPNVATPNAVNSFAFHDEIVINEIMYHAPATLATGGEPAQYDVTTFLPIDAQWKYEASGVDLGTAWRTPQYDDDAWLSGPGLLGFETSPLSLPEALQTVVTPGTQLTYYFRTQFEFSGDPASVDMQLRTVIDDGAVIYLNGEELFRIGVPAGPLTFTTQSSRTVSDAAYEGPFSISTDNLLVGTNTLAVEVHQQATTSSDMILGLELTERTLVTPAMPGTPFAANDEEWIELYNRSNQAVDLSGWRLDGGVNYDFALGTTIAAGAYLVVARDPVALSAKYPAIAIVGDYSGSLGDGGDRIRLEDAVGNPADEVQYFDDGRWSIYADGGGSSLELIDPDADNSRAEAWAPSNEAANSEWATVSYRGFAIADIGPTNFNELIIGMLDSGEVLLDDISVIENPGRPEARQLIQNGGFDAGTAATWRLMGNHSASHVVVDPGDPANQVLRFISTGQMEHLSNHAETTLKDGATYVTISSGREYEISFRAKWLAGSRQLRTNLYFNRLPRVTILDAPTENGTPGRQNSRYENNFGPTYTDFRHGPVVPAAGEPVTVSVAAEDPDGVATMTLRYAVDGGAFASVAMSATAGGTYAANVPGQSSGRVVQFYVEGTDALGATTTFPAADAASRALYKVQDNQAQLGEVHNFRIIMTPADTTLLHTNSNLMSNDLLGATVVYDENEVFYDVGVRQKGSTYGRTADQFVSFIVKFHPDELFRGVHDSVAIDRSARGPVGSPNVDEILIKHVLNHAGGVASNYSDVIRVIAPRAAHTSIAQLDMAQYGDVFLDSQFASGGDDPVFEFDGAYYLNSTTDGNPESPKVVQPNGISYTDIRDLGDDKELYRNNWIIKDNRDEDDFDAIIAMNKAFSLNGAELDAAIGDVIDVDQWARHYAVLSLTGVSDTYTHGNPHNLRVYQRPEDGLFVSFPHDMDTSFQRATNVGLMGGSNWNLVKIFQRPQYIRLFYGNLYDLIQTTYNTAYMQRWTEHYGDLANTSFAGILGYIGARASFVQSQLAIVAPQVPFAITTNGGGDFSVATPTVTLVGNGWINVDEIRLAGDDGPLDVTWTDQDSWQVVLPLSTGANAIALQAYDRQGNLVSSDSITVTSTFIGPNPVRDLRITELMYHPDDPTAEEFAAGFTDSDEFEFIELRNIGDHSLDLSSLRFTNGVSFDFSTAAVTTLDPGEYLLLVENIDAFNFRYNNPPVAIAGQYSGRLDNAGERIVVQDAVGVTIHDFTYDDNGPGWHTSTDGEGYSLVILNSSGPTASWSDGASWRPSFEPGGSPGQRDWMFGDFDNDNDVDLVDLVFLQGRLGTPSGATLSGGDLTGDGAVDRGDVARFARNFGRSYVEPMGAASPVAAASAIVTGAARQADADRPTELTVRRRAMRRHAVATDAALHELTRASARQEDSADEFSTLRGGRLQRRTAIRSATRALP